MRLKGVVRQAATGTRSAVVDPAELLTGDEEGDEVHVRRKGDGDDDDDVRSAAPDGAPGHLPAAGDDDARSATPLPGGARGGDDDDDDDDKAAANGDGDDDDDDDAALVQSLLAKQGAGRGKASALSYTRFPALDDYFIGQTMHSVVTPAAASSFIDANGVDKAVLDDLCAARFEITMPGTVVSVIPDIVRECLEQVAFPSSNAQVAEALWLPDKGKDSGQLILQGEGAKLRTALRVVAPFAERCPGINVKGVTSTDVRDIAETFGIEAAYDFLSKELVKLFKRHAVDARHCSLIADMATFRGIWHAFNFNGMIAHSSSPLFQMTFASSRKFLERAISRGVPDDLNSFSAAIMVGERPHVGTGTVGLSVDADVIQATVAERPARAPKPMRPVPDMPPPL
jgi:DNA-directed RNA polymerase I subunit RPA1